MNILLEFYDVYTLQQLLEVLRDIASKHEYKLRKNPTLELYAKSQYHGIINIFVSINKTTKTISAKLGIDSGSPLVWQSRCESGWEEILAHNLASNAEEFSLPTFDLDTSELSEDMINGLTIACVRTIMTPAMLKSQSAFTSMAMLSRPALITPLNENHLKQFEMVMFLLGASWASLMEHTSKGVDIQSLNTNVYLVSKEPLEELIGCPIDVISSQLGFSKIMTKGNKDLKAKLTKSPNGWAGLDSVVIGKEIVGLKDLEEASDTNGGLLTRMLQKLPTTQMSVVHVRVKNIPGSGLWAFTNPIGVGAPDNNKNYFLYAIKSDGLIRKIYVQIESKKITIKDEIFN